MSQTKKSIFSNIGIQIIIAMVLGTIVGVIMKHDAVVFAPLGTIFIHLIKMLVIPLIAISIISGAASIGGTKSAGKIGALTFAFFLITSGFAVALALTMGEYFTPGIGVDLSSVEGMFSNEYASKGELPGFFETITGIIPTNIFVSLNNANILQILFFCLFLGIAISKLEKKEIRVITWWD